MLKNRPSIHLLIQVTIFLTTVIAYSAIVIGAKMRGYSPSTLVAIRDVSMVGAAVVCFAIMVSTLRYRGNLIIYTSVVLLFSLGQVAQFRIFSDPEYTARGDQRAAARLSKAHALRAKAIEEGYDRAKLEAVFGPDVKMSDTPSPRQEGGEKIAIMEVLTSSRTVSPILSLAGLLTAMIMIRRERILLWVQRHSIVIAMATMLPLMVAIILFTRGGKFMGGFTPWEPAKILFLFSLTGILVDSYRVLGRTKWGLPPNRFMLPLVITASFGLIPFFVLGDFGQLLVFGVVYTVLYLVAVKRPGQLVPGLAILVAAFTLISSIGGIPDRVKFRYHLWEHTWEPPPQDAGWWAPELARLRTGYGNAGKAMTNEEAWYDRGSQVVQALFGVSHGQLAGMGLGLGLPETVPVADSDFIYAVIAEELGLLGGLCLLLAVFLLGAAGWREALDAPDMFTKLLAAGVAAFLFSQAFVNMAGVLKVTPMTGITLPFVSHGGWSLLTSFTMIGILMGISHRNAVQSWRTDQS